MIKTRPVVLVLSAASGTGKTTVLKELTKISDNIFYSISATTRKIRRGERNGRDYIFLDQSTFEAWIESDRLLEWAKVYGEYYGTPKEPVISALNRGYNVVADLDLQGMKKLKAFFRQDFVSVFLWPPDITTLKARLINRNTENESELKKRLKTLNKELAWAKFYDYWVINDSVRSAAHKLNAIITSKNLQKKRLIQINPDIFSFE